MPGLQSLDRVVSVKLADALVLDREVVSYKWANITFGFRGVILKSLQILLKRHALHARAEKIRLAVE